MSSPRLDRRAPTRPPHPLRQSQTIDYSAVARQLSNASSSASSGYSNASSGLFTYGGAASAVSSSSSPTSTYSTDPRQLHRRGQSEAARPTLKSSQSAPAPALSTQMSAETIYNTARQSLRPLPPPTATAPSGPAKTSPGRHDRGQSLDIATLNLGRLSMAGQDGSASPAPSPPLRSRASMVRPTSMLLARSDSLSVRHSVEAGPPASSPPTLVHAQAAPITTPELERLGRSSTNQLRTLSQLAQSPDADQFALSTTAQDVVGLRGRRRLQRASQSASKKPGQRNGYGWEGRNWMDKQRQFLQAYEYLCHIGEAKEWIEDIIHKPIPAIVELEEALRDGVTLAEVVEALNPTRRFRIFHHPRLQFRHSDNIAIFFRYLDEVELPDLFRFELIDLYEKKNIPKVIYCIHALSWLLFRKGIVDFQIGNLVGQLDFERHELEAMQKGLDKLGTSMPSFGNMGANFGVESPPTPEPEESEEDRIDRELGENEASVVEFQAQVRGAIERMRIARTLQTLWDAEPWLVGLQSRVRGDWTREVINYRLGRRRFAVALQSAARGFLARRRQAHQEHACRSAEPRVVKLQSAIRARRVRDEVRHERSRLERVAGPVRAIQAVSRGFLMRRHVQKQARETSREAGNVALLQGVARGVLFRKRVQKDLYFLHEQTRAISALQAAARGVLLRKRVQKDLGLLHEQTPAISALQAAARGALLRKWVQKDLGLLHEQTPAISALQAAARAVLARTQLERQREALRGFGPQWQAIQAAGRGNLARANLGALKAALRQHSPATGRLQACARAGAARRDVAKTLEGIQANEAAVVDLQSMIRGMLQREQVSDDLDALDHQTANTTNLQAHIRGMLSRQGCERVLDDLQDSEAEIVALQGLARAMLRRGEVATVLERLDEQEEVVAAVQAAAKAFVVRAKFEDKKRHFKENMQKVVKIQSFVRAKLQGEAYKSLTTGKNPPVGAVKNFVHLLNDSDFDFNEEVEFERLRKTVVQQVRQNEMLEQYIDQLDIKIALLVKNKITLDEVVRHQSNYGGHTSSLLANSTMASTNQFDLKALNKSSRKKLELYQQLFFTLQTQPQYLARLFKRIREQGIAEHECKRIEHLMMGLFGYAQKRREEYYLLKLIGRSIREEVDACNSAQEYLRGNFFWTKLLANYTRSPRDRKYLRDLLGPLIRDNIVEDPALDLESDPMQIYRSAINNEELRTGRPSNRPLDIPREMAIKDAETRELFIDHLRDLREICDQFLLALEDLLPRMPYGLRFVCRQNYEALCQHFKREPQHHLLQLVVTWLWRFYLHPALVAPENVGVADRQFSPLQRRNLGEVAKVLGQIASGRPFGGDNIYLQPLNAFVGESVERLLHIANELISIPDAESTFHIDEFNDLYAKNKPTLYIKMTDIFAIHNLVATGLGVMCPPQSINRDDVLREIMQDLGSAKNNESEMTAAGSTDIQMFLTPKLHDLEDPEAEVKALFMETKRCILYIIRVQQGANLLEILVKPIGEEDEMRWASLLREDFQFDGGKGASGRPTSTRGAYSDANMIDVTRMSYHELKRTALENVMRLERMGRISKHNYYQDVLNAIALDIRSKSRRRVQRQRELEGVRLTLANLHEKAKYLELQRKSYDDYIEQAMATLQNKKGKKRFLLPFTKQYNHQRELERSGRVPKFGSYKYSARALADKGVLVSWAGTAERDWGQLNLTLSCDQVGVFSLEGSRGHIQIPGASALVPIEDLLQAQFDGLQFMTLFEGNLKLNVNLLLHRVYKKFYRTQ